MALGIGWAAIIAASVVGRIGPLRTARGSFVAAPFLLAAVPLIFVRPGEPLATIALGPADLTVSGEGLREFATLAGKSWLSVQAALLLGFTTPFHDLVEGLRRLRLPRIMVGIMSFMYRYLGVLTDEASRMLRARAARSAALPGVRAGGSTRWRASVAGNLVGSLFLRSYERSERIYAAMLARGFEGDVRHLAGSPLTTASLAALACLVLLLGGFVVAAQTWLPRL